MKIEITSRKWITPSSPTPPHLQSLKISSFDQHGQNHYVPSFYFYPANEEECGVISNAAKSLRLQKSLSEILTLYYPLAGRYSSDEPLIECNDKGAEYLEAQVAGSLSQLLSDEELETQLQNHFVPPMFDPISSPPLVVQFNRFECGGIAIGVSMTHKMVDAFSAFGFITAWATACRIGIDKACPPSFELGSIFPPRDAFRIENWERKATATNKIVTKRFVFDAVAISNLKAAVSASARNNSSELPKQQITRVKAVAALIWGSCIRVSQAVHGRMRPSIIKFPINLRGKTNLPIPENSCGNFAGWSAPHFMPNDEGEVKIHELVSRIHDGIEQTLTNYAKASSSDEFFIMVMNDFRKLDEALKQTEQQDVYLFSCWCRFPMYEADFGWGKPTLVSRGVQAHKEMILLFDTKDGNGIDAWVSLEENNMLLFKQDPDLLAFTT
jgi:shikimate O-hydroxycinnamoyltransferase